MRILYIRRRPTAISGGSRCQDANKEMLDRIAGTSNVWEYSKGEITENKYQRNINRLFIGKYNNFSSKDLQAIIRIIKNECINCLFFEGSKTGLVAKQIKKKFPHIKIITFFHNVEYLFSLSYIRKLCFYQRALAQMDLLNIYIAEKSACEVSDVIIALNDRDASLIKDKYGRYPDAVFPISLKDNFDSAYLKPHNNTIPIGLMVGSNFPPNADGLDWFINNVLPFVKIEFYVVGSGMDILSAKYADIKNLHIYGFVDDLKEFYSKADFMIMPIFEGSGMKVKTAEALSFGKYIFAAPEAAEGYAYSDNEIKVCHNADEFIKAINCYKMEKHLNGYCKSSRDLYLKEYSYQALEGRYRKMLNFVTK